VCMCVEMKIWCVWHMRDRVGVVKRRSCDEWCLLKQFTVCHFQYFVEEFSCLWILRTFFTKWKGIKLTANWRVDLCLPALPFLAVTTNALFHICKRLWFVLFLGDLLLRESRRKTPTIVTIKDGERLFGDASLSAVSYQLNICCILTANCWVMPSKWCSADPIFWFYFGFTTVTDHIPEVPGFLDCCNCMHTWWSMWNIVSLTWILFKFLSLTDVVHKLLSWWICKESCIFIEICKTWFEQVREENVF